MTFNRWSDQIDLTRRPLSKGGGWVCTLHMHDAENILTGDGETMEEAYSNAEAGAGKRRHIPAWILPSVAMSVAGFAGVHASLTSNPVQIVASVVAVLTAIRLLVLRT